MAAAGPGIAITAKLKATSGVAALVSGRVYPQLDTQESAFPQIVYTILGGESGKTLGGGSNSLKRYTVQVDCYAETELEAVTLGRAVVAGLKNWSDDATGVQGCFHEDTAAGFTEDGYRFQSETFGVWHAAT